MPLLLQTHKQSASQSNCPWSHYSCFLDWPEHDDGDDDDDDNYKCRYFCRPINKQQPRATVMKEETAEPLCWLLWLTLASSAALHCGAGPTPCHQLTDMLTGPRPSLARLYWIVTVHLGACKFVLSKPAPSLGWVSKTPVTENSVLGDIFSQMLTVRLPPLTAVLVFDAFPK